MYVIHALNQLENLFKKINRTEYFKVLNIDLMQVHLLFTENSLFLNLQLAVNKIKAVLTFSGGWMVDELSIEANPDEAADARSCQLLRIRQLCIPELVSLLHKILHETGAYQQCVRIADLIASEDHQLYKVSL